MSATIDNWAAERYFDHAIQRSAIRVKPSQLYVTADNEVITTTLGSCVAVCLSDSVHRVYGMNHFMLPDPLRHDGPVGLNARYGVQSMELLMNAMFKLGAQRPWLTARVYGGAKLLRGMPDIGAVNVEFAVRFLDCENIPILGAEVGGEQALCVHWNVPLSEPRVDRLSSLKSRLNQLGHERAAPSSASKAGSTLFDESNEVTTA